MSWIWMILIYYVVCTYCGMGLLYIRYHKESEVSILIYFVFGAICGWIITPIIIVGYLFKYIVFGIGWCVIKLMEVFDIQ